jgi:hypothetical protein
LVSKYVQTLTAFPNGTNGINLFAGTLKGVYLSTNNGSSWTAAGLINYSVYGLAVSDTNLFALKGSGVGFNGCVYLSTDKGTTWTDVNSGLLNTTVNTLAVSEGYLFAGADGSSVWRRPLSDMITSVGSEALFPVEFILEQNYPNPFNPSTKVRYSVPNSSQVTLKIFNTLGEEIAILINEEKPAGTYELTWNAENLPSGIYFYRIQAGSFVQTKKMILMK